jgi:hypothetical protein
MAWARVTSATLNANTGVSTASWNAGSLGATPSANARAVAVINNNRAGGQPTVTGITDDSGVTWEKLTSIQPTTGRGYGSESSVWTAVCNGSAMNNITVAFGGTGSGGFGASIAVGAYTGLTIATGSANIIDNGVVKYSSANNGPSPRDSGTTSNTTTAANELKLGCYTDAGDNQTISAGTLDTTYSIFTKNDGNGNSQVALEDADSGSAGSTARATVTATGSSDYEMAVVVIKLAAPAIFVPRQTYMAPILTQ